jgi:hypothetical protein
MQPAPAKAKLHSEEYGTINAPQLFGRKLIEN